MRFRDLKTIDQIIIHCAATPNGFDRYTIADINAWHAKPPLNGYRSDAAMARDGASPYRHCGYHYVIHVDGSVHKGRELTEVGAHAAGNNRRSIGICLVGRNAFTVQQWDALRDLHRDLANKLGHEVRVLGHRDLKSNKTCPGFDVQRWKRDGAPRERRICKVRYDKN